MKIEWRRADSGDEWSSIEALNPRVAMEKLAFDTQAADRDPVLIETKNNGFWWIQLETQISAIAKPDITRKD